MTALTARADVRRASLQHGKSGDSLLIRFCVSPDGNCGRQIGILSPDFMTSVCSDLLGGRQRTDHNVVPVWVT